MNAEALEALIGRIEKASPPYGAVSFDIWEAADRPAEWAVRGFKLDPPDYMESFDAALTLLPEGSDWRRFTPRSCSVYAASPYNAKAEVRHDGYGPTPAAQLCAAIFKMHLAKAKQMEKARG